MKRVDGCSPVNEPSGAEGAINMILQDGIIFLLCLQCVASLSPGLENTQATKHDP